MVILVFIDDMEKLCYSLGIGFFSLVGGSLFVDYLFNISRELYCF